MKKIQIIYMVVFLCVTAPVFAQETSSSTSCMSTLGYQGSLDDLKDELLTAVKNEAVQELFGEFITPLLEVENFAITEEEIRVVAREFVQVKGEPEYYNGQNLAEVCVKIEAYATGDDIEKFKPQTLTQKSCITEGDEITIKQDTEEKAILQALTNYDQRVQDFPHEQVLSLAREVTFSDGGLIPETKTYCVKANGVIYPIEMVGVLIPPEPTPTPEPLRTEFSIDLTPYAHGDIPVEIPGQNLLIRQTKDGENYICGQIATPSGEINIEDLSLSDSFELLIKANWAVTPNIPRYWPYKPPGVSFSQAIHVLSRTGEEIKIEFIKGTQQYKGDIQFGHIKKDWKKTAWHTGINTIRLLVKGKQAKLFINDQLFGTILVKPNVDYSTVMVKGIIDHDAIYELSVRKL